MKAVILAGGLGTRISEESDIRPKPMVEIGGMPILWHIMKIYSANGIKEFIICCGYKSHVIKEYFANYALYRSDVTFDVANHTTKIEKNGAEDWKITLVETGENTMTGGRIKRVKDYIGDETFCMTYGDGLTDAHIEEVVRFHKKQNTLATMTGVLPPGRFGAITLSPDKNKVESFREKPRGDGAWVNGGFFVLEPKVLDYIEGDETVFEKEPLEKLAAEGEISVFKHEGYWRGMDSVRDKRVLEEEWQSGHAPWKKW